MREMKDSGNKWIGLIPKTWGVERIKTIFSERSELSEDGSETLLSVSEYYGVANRAEKVEDGEYVSRAESLVGYKKCYKGDLVSNIMLAWKGSMGVTELDGIVSPAYCVYKPSKSVYPRYYHYLFRTSLYTSIFRLYSKGIIDSRLRLYSPYFFDIKAIIPSLAEQQKIAEFLDRKCAEVDEMIGLQEQIIEELKAYKQSVITEAVTKGLNPDAPMRDSGIEWIGQTPEHWEVTRLKFYASIDSGDAISNEKISEEGDYPVYGGGDIMGYYSDYNTTEDKLIIGRVGARCGCVTMLKQRCWASDNALVLKSALPLKYTYHLLQAIDLNRLNTSNAQPLITATKVKNVFIPLTPLAEQQAIADYLDEKCADIDSLIQTKQEKIDSLKEYKKSIIYEYVTGKKEV